MPLFWIATLAFLSLLLGILYSIFNTDPHHWGFIIGTALDYIKGRELFSEVYIQYGAGEPILFRFLNHFLPIHYTSLGVIASFFYTGTLTLIFLSLRQIATPRNAFLISAFSLLTHPYATYPWPDYFAGFFIAAGCFVLLKNVFQNQTANATLTGILFFTAFLFRNTYLLSFMLMIMAYGIIALINARVRSRTLIVTFLTFVFCVLTYLSVLYLQGHFFQWFGQTLGAGAGQYGINLNSIIVLLQHAFFPHKFWLPNQFVYTFFAIFMWLSVFIVLTFLFKKDEKKHWKQKFAPGHLLFFALLGLSGMIQGALGYEIFRIQNISSSIFLVFAALLPSVFSKRIKLSLSLAIILLLTLFPRASSLWPIYDGKIGDYTESSIPLFHSHRFTAEYHAHYQKIFDLACNGTSPILNYSSDSALSHLCPSQKTVLKLPFFNPQMLARIDAEAFQKISSGDFDQGTIVFADTPLPSNPKVQLNFLGETTRPETVRFLGPSTVRIYLVKRINP